MSKFTAFLSKKKADASQEKDAVAEVRNWYSDRYQTVVVQRNLLFLVTIISLIGVFISVFVVRQVTASRSIEPFVIEIEKKSGIATVVDPMDRKQLPAEEELTKYFVSKYVMARETYDPVNYEYNYFTVVRLLSSGNLYYPFKNYILSNPQSPRLLYGEGSASRMKIRSITLPNAGEARVAFTLTLSGSRGGTFNKVATMRFGYYTLEMSQDERYINPLGFQVIAYRVDEETL